MDHLSDHSLVHRCRQGDRAAQRELYAGTADRIYRLLLRMTGNAEDAGDLAQETYLKVFTRIGEFKGTSSITTWIYRIAVNEALQHRRSGKRRDEKLQALWSAGQRGPSSNQDQLSLELRDALAGLPEWERTLIILRHFDGLSYDELAEVLNRPAGTIASALNRARRLLRDRLQPESAAAREDSGGSEHLTGR